LCMNGKLEKSVKKRRRELALGSGWRGMVEREVYLECE
jgi:hypothetical protein